MIDLLARTLVRRARAVLVTSAVLLVVAAVLGAGALTRLQSGGFDDPAAESAQAAQVLAERLGRPTPNLVLLVTAPAGSGVDDAAVAAVGRDAARRLQAEPDVTVVADYWSAPPAAAAGLRSADGRAALVVAHLDGTEDDWRVRIPLLHAAHARTVDGMQVQTGGLAQSVTDITAQVKRDLGLAEAIAVPATLVLLVAVFGSLVAGLLPLLVGVVAMVGTLAVLRALTAVTDVSVFSLNLTLALGLGLGIDYALLVVNRFREHLEAAGGTDADVARALRLTLHTAGRTVLYSAATVALALSALLAFPMYFLRSFAYAGIAVTVVTAAAALVVLPAALRLLGPRAAHRRFGRQPRTDDGAFWARVARVVMRRPVLTAAPVLGLLVLLALPAASADFGLPDDRAIGAAHSPARQVGDVLRSDFASRESDALTVVLPGLGHADPASSAPLAAYSARLSTLPGATRVDSPTGSYAAGARIGPGRTGLTGDGAAAVLVVPTDTAYAPATQELLGAVRAEPAPTEPLVGGLTARFVDVNAAIAERLPLVGALIALTTFVVVFLFTGSVLLPLKALAVNALTIAAVLGAMVWVFEDGHGAQLLGATAMPLSVSIPPLMFCLAFGLSMDYEVFLLGRIAEARTAGLGDRDAVAHGLARTGRIVTAAAALMSVTFLAFATSRVSFIQMLGLGCALAVLLDATLVRGVLVPALMRLFGRANWWAPAPLVRLHDRLAVRHGPSPGLLDHPHAGVPLAQHPLAATPPMPALVRQESS